MGKSFLDEFSKVVVKNLREYVEYQKYKQYLPINPMHDDIYIVEFPKSGITWMSFIIANIELMRRDIRESPTFYNIHRYVPDVHQLKGAKVNRVFSPAFLKSHSPYNPFYFHVVYLLRNPVDVMVSYFNFQRFLGYRASFEEFVMSSNFGISAWKEHVKGWLMGEPSAQRIHLIKYEDLLKEPRKVISALYVNLGIEVSVELIEKAIKMSSLEKMKYWEKIMVEFNPRYTSTFFVGKDGKIKKQELLTPRLERYIVEECKDVLRRFYPKLLELI